MLDDEHPFLPRHKMKNPRNTILAIVATGLLAGCGDHTANPTLLSPRAASHDDAFVPVAVYPPWVDSSAVGASANRVSTSGKLANSLSPLAGPNFILTSAPSLVLNGSFELNAVAGSRVFTDWTTNDLGSGFWAVEAGTSYAGFTVAAPTVGSFAAMTQQPGPGSHVLYQDVTLPAGASTLSFDIAVFNRAGSFISPASLDENAGPNQQARVDIMNPSAPLRDVGAGVRRNVFQTHPGDPLLEPYRHITADLSDFAGQTIRIRFAEADNQLFIQTGVDNVQIVSSDATPPTVTPVISGTLNASGWYTSDVTVSWSVVDAESTPSACAATTITTGTAGQVVTCTSTSAGGSTTASVTIKMDKTIPTVAGSVTSGTSGANGWYTSPIGVTWNISPAGVSGQSQSPDCANTTLSTSTAAFAFTCTVTTTAGVSSAQGTVNVKLDTSAPVVDGAASGLLGNNGWFRGDVNVAFTTSDPTSGVASTSGCAATSLTTDNAGVTNVCSAINGAGLSASKSITVKRDATNPLIGYTGNAGAYTADQTVAITCSASDATSHLASTTCANISGPAYTFTLGGAANTFSAQATDNAGNSSSASTSFTVALTCQSMYPLITRFVSGDKWPKQLTGRMDNICDKVAKDNPSEDEQVKNFLKELDRAVQDGAVSASNAAILSRLVQLL
jgi:hypothetical protein